MSHAVRQLDGSKATGEAGMANRIRGECRRLDGSKATGISKM